MEIKLPKAETAYCFIEQSSTGEVHIFEGGISSDECNFITKSICEGVFLNEGQSRQLSVCLDENEVKLEADSNVEVVCKSCLSLM